MLGSCAAGASAGVLALDRVLGLLWGWGRPDRGRRVGLVSIRLFLRERLRGNDGCLEAGWRNTRIGEGSLEPRGEGVTELFADDCFELFLWSESEVDEETETGCEDESWGCELADR